MMPKTFIPHAHNEPDTLRLPPMVVWMVMEHNEDLGDRSERVVSVHDSEEGAKLARRAMTDEWIECRRVWRSTDTR